MKTDRLTVQMVVGFIGATCLLCIGGLILLSLTGHQTPESLTTLGGAAIGALGSLLARTSTEASSIDSTVEPAPSSCNASETPPSIDAPSVQENRVQAKTSDLPEEGD